MIQKIAIFFYFLLSPAFSTEQHTDNLQVLFSKQSPFGLIEVIRTPDGNLNICEDKDYTQTHSVIHQGDPTYMGAKYTSLATASFCFSKNLNSILLLGLGGGEFLSYFANYFPDTSVDVLEINPVMIEIVKDFRNIKINEKKVKFICADAFKYVADINKMYDLIFCDIYFFTPPIASQYKNFFERVNLRLNHGGVFVFNVIEMPRAVIEDMFHTFDNITTLDTQKGNIIFICYQGPVKTKEALQNIAAQLQSHHHFRYSLSDISKEIECVLPAKRSILLQQFTK